MKRIVLMVCFLCLFLVSAAAADIIHLKNGNIYEGRIIKEDDEKMAVKTSIMTIVLNKNEVQAIQRDYPSLDSRMATGEKFDIVDVLKEKDEDSGIKVIKREDLNFD